MYRKWHFKCFQNSEQETPWSAGEVSEDFMKAVLCHLHFTDESKIVLWAGLPWKNLLGQREHVCNPGGGTMPEIPALQEVGGHWIWWEGHQGNRKSIKVVALEPEERKATLYHEIWNQLMKQFWIFSCRKWRVPGNEGGLGFLWHFKYL